MRSRSSTRSTTSLERASRGASSPRSAFPDSGASRLRRVLERRARVGAGVTRARDCAFCGIVAGGDGHIVHADEQVIAFLDRAPLIKGHVLVIPRAHVETFDELPDELIAPLFGVVQRVSRSFASA